MINFQSGKQISKKKKKKKKKEEKKKVQKEVRKRKISTRAHTVTRCIFSNSKVSTHFHISYTMILTWISSSCRGQSPMNSQMSRK